MWLCYNQTSNNKLAIIKLLLEVIAWKAIKFNSVEKVNGVEKGLY